MHRELISAVQYTYLFLYAVPVLHFKKELAPRFFISRGFRSFLLLSDRGFLKLAISRNATVGLEYANYRQLLDSCPDLADVLPAYRSVKTIGLDTLACERLYKVPSIEALESAVLLYRRFLQSSTRSVRLVLSESAQIQEGLHQIEMKFGLTTASALQNSTRIFMASGEYTIGLAHGDFQSRNIMRDASGILRLIDLDCVRLCGVIEFDALYFVLEHEWSKSGQLWTDTLAEGFRSNGSNIASSLKAFSVDWSNELGIACFLDRIGQEFINYGIRYSYPGLATVIDAALIAAN
jgi:hypothetical protein